MSEGNITIETLYRWLFDHYAEHMTGGEINVGSLEAALATAYAGRPNPELHEFVVSFCLSLQEVAKGKKRAQ